MRESQCRYEEKPQDVPRAAALCSTPSGMRVLSKDACVCFPEQQNLFSQAASPLLIARTQHRGDCCELEKRRGVFPPSWEIDRLYCFSPGKNSALVSGYVKRP